MDGFRRHILIYSGIISGSALFLILGGLWISQSIAAHSQQIALQRSLVTGRAKSLEVLARLKQNSREVDAYAASMARLLPEREELLNFPRWLELFGRSSQVGLNFSYQGGAIAQPTETTAGFIGFNLEVIGSMDKLVQFVDELETKSRQYLVAFDAYDFTRQNDQYRLIMTGKVFFR
jgi:hypothetical protein